MKNTNENANMLKDRREEMITIENVEVVGWEHAIRGMRNPMNSWEKGDSESCCGSGNCQNCLYYDACPTCYMPFVIGPNDLDLMKRLVSGGPVHAKFRRMITVYLDITAPLYWWKEFDTYKVGTVANSCSTMHKIHEKESYNQRRTVMLNYEVLAGIYECCDAHKLDEWRDFFRWIESLPYSEIIIGEKITDAERVMRLLDEGKTPNEVREIFGLPVKEESAFLV